MQVCYMTGGVTRGGHDAERSFYEVSVVHQAIWRHRDRGSLFQQAAQEHQNSLFRYMFAKPTADAFARGLPCQERFFGFGKVDRHTEGALQERCSGRMIVVPVRQQNRPQAVRRNA